MSWRVYWLANRLLEATSVTSDPALGGARTPSFQLHSRWVCHPLEEVITGLHPRSITRALSCDRVSAFAQPHSTPTSVLCALYYETYSHPRLLPSAPTYVSLLTTSTYCHWCWVYLCVHTLYFGSANPNVCSTYAREHYTHIRASLPLCMPLLAAITEL